MLIRFGSWARGVALVAVLGAVASPALAGDAGHGKSVFLAQCSSCHTAAKGGGTLLGPNLYGVVGRKAGSLPGFSYSSAMKAAGYIWSDARLAAFLPSPGTAVAGTRMSYLGLHNAGQMADLIAYLDTLK